MLTESPRSISNRSPFSIELEHVFECSVIVVWVRRRDFVGEEHRRVQELHVGLDWGLAEVMDLGLKTCGEGEDVSGVHTLLGGVVQVCHELLVVGEEKVRQEEQEVESEGQVKRPHTCGWT